MLSGKAATESLFKTLFALVPLGGGQLLSEAFFDYRSRVKQDRLNHFLESLISYFQNNGGPGLEAGLIESDAFGDLFESILRRVVLNHHPEKMLRFRNVITGFAEGTVTNEYRETFLDLIDRLNESHIRILKAHATISAPVRNYFRQREGLDAEISKLSVQLEAAKNEVQQDAYNGPDYYDITRVIYGLSEELKKVNEKIDQDAAIRKADHYGVSDSEYLFLIQDLYSKALLTDQGIGTFDTKPFEHMAITDFGRQFLQFIETAHSL